MIKNFFKLTKNKIIIVLCLVAILSVVTIKLVNSNDQSNETYIITGDDDEDTSVNTTEDIINLKEESLLGEWDFDTDIENKAYSKPSKIKLTFKSNFDVITDISLLDHGNYITDLDESKYEIGKDKNGETYIKVLHDIDPSIKDTIDPKYNDYMFKFVIKEIQENKIDVELKYLSKESKNETLEGSLIKINEHS